MDCLPLTPPVGNGGCASPALRLVAILGFGLALASSVRADSKDEKKPWRFVEVGREAGLDFVQRSGEPTQRAIVEVKSSGVAVLDYDRDGRQDLLFTQGSTLERHREGRAGFGLRLFRNRGGLRFEETTESAGLAALELGWASGAAVADVDGDGWVDVLVTAYGRDRLLRNREGRFEDVSEAAGLADNGWSTGAAFGDLDGDGDLDVYTAGYLDFDFDHPPAHGARRADGTVYSCLWKGFEVVCGPRGLPPRRDTVRENAGDGTFRDVTESWGFAQVAPAYGLGVVIADLTGDSRPDVFVANDSSPNFLFERRGDTFIDVAFAAGVSVNEDGEEQAGMGVDVLDLDGDDRLDLLVTNFEDERNNAYVHTGRGFFNDRSTAVGLGTPGHRFLSWGIAGYDFDRDGLLDIFVANGHVYPQADQATGSEGYAQRDHMFVGRSGAPSPRFEERGASLGITRSAVSRGAAFGDLDEDGDVDIVVCNLNDRPSLYENRSPRENRGGVITLRQEGANREALGAHVRIDWGPVRRHHVVRRQHSFLGSSDPRLFIGLGTEAQAGTALVRWPGGVGEAFDLPEGGGAVTLVRGQGRTPK